MRQSSTYYMVPSVLCCLQIYFVSQTHCGEDKFKLVNKSPEFNRSLKCVLCFDCYTVQCMILFGLLGFLKMLSIIKIFHSLVEVFNLI